MDRRGVLQILTGWVAKAFSPVPRGPARGWWPLVKEPFTGAWQQNQDITAGTVLTSSAVYACVSLIASDIGKLCGNGLRLVAQDANDIWTKTESPAFSPFLRRPNHYQNRIKFAEQWITSKLVHGNTYVLKQRDARGIVIAGYILDPTKVIPLVSTSGDVYYELKRDDLSGVADGQVVVPARDIIHDLMVALYHPLCGVSPIYACGVAALQGLAIQTSSQAFFQNSSQPGGVLTSPLEISDETAASMKERWLAGFTGSNAGKIAVLGSGLKYEPAAITAVDAQLIDQLKWSAETVCSCFHVAPYMVGIGPPPPYANVEPLTILYYSQCLQSLIENFELCLDEGLELPRPYGTEICLDDLMRMDTVSKTTAAKTATAAGMTINEARAKYYDLGPVKGGETVYLQQQMWPIEELTGRPLPGSMAPAPALPPAEDGDAEAVPEAASLATVLYQRAIAEGLLHVA